MKSRAIIFVALMTIAVMMGCMTLREKPDGGGHAVIIIDFGPSMPGEPHEFSPGTYEFENGTFRPINTSSTVVWLYEIDFNEGDTVFTALMDFSRHAGFGVEYENYSYGVFVVSIAGVRNQGSGGLNWQYWVNSQYASVAMDNQYLRDGDRIEIRYCGDPFT